MTIVRWDSRLGLMPYESCRGQRVPSPSPVGSSTDHGACVRLCRSAPTGAEQGSSRLIVTERDLAAGVGRFALA